MMYVKLKFDKDGLLPMIVQDADSGAVLSLFYANKEAVEKTMEEGYIWRYSRKLGRLSKKGEQSGNSQRVISVGTDCDSDALLVKVRSDGPMCHTGAYSCFSGAKPILQELTEVLADRKKNPKKGSYTSGLLHDQEGIASKLREEVEELIEAEKDEDIAWEAADLLFFMLVYLENRDIKFSKVLDELRRRRKE